MVTERENNTAIITAAQCGLKLFFTHRRSRDSRRTFGSEQTTRSLETHRRTHASQNQSVITVMIDRVEQSYNLNLIINHKVD